METDSDEDEFFDAHEELTFQRFNSFRSSFLTYRNYASSNHQNQQNNAHRTESNINNNRNESGVAGATAINDTAENNNKKEEKQSAATPPNTGDDIDNDYLNRDTIELVNIFNIYNVYNIYYNAEECVTVKTPVNTGTSSPLPVAPPRKKKETTKRVTRLKEIEYVDLKEEPIPEEGNGEAVYSPVRKKPFKLLPPPPPNHCRIKAQCIDILDGINQTTSECDSGRSSRVGKRSASFSGQRTNWPESDTSADRTPVNKRRNKILPQKENGFGKNERKVEAEIFSDSSAGQWTPVKDNCYTSDDQGTPRVGYRPRYANIQNYSQTIAYSDSHQSLNFTDATAESSCAESNDEFIARGFNPRHKGLSHSMVDINERTLADFSIQEYSPRILYKKGDQSSTVVSEKEDFCSSNVVSNDEDVVNMQSIQEKQRRCNKRYAPVYSRKVYAARVLDDEAESTDASSYAHEYPSGAVSADEKQLSSRSNRNKIRRSGQVNKKRRVFANYTNDRYTVKHQVNDDEYSIVSDDGDCSSSTVSNDEYPAKVMRRLRHTGFVNPDRRRVVISGNMNGMHQDDDQSSIVSTVDECSSSVFSNDEEPMKPIANGHESRLPSFEEGDESDQIFSINGFSFKPPIICHEDDQSSSLSTADECPLNLSEINGKPVTKIKNVTKSQGIVNIDQRLLDMYSNEKNLPLKIRGSKHDESGISSCNSSLQQQMDNENQLTKIIQKTITSEFIEVNSNGDYTTSYVLNESSMIKNAGNGIADDFNDNIVSNDEHNELIKEELNKTKFTEIEINKYYSSGKESCPNYPSMLTTDEEEGIVIEDRDSTLASTDEKSPSDDAGTTTSGIVQDKTTSESDKPASTEEFSSAHMSSSNAEESESPITSVIDDSSSNMASNDEEAICDKIRSLRVGSIDKRYSGIHTTDESSIISNQDDFSISVVTSDENSLTEVEETPRRYGFRKYNRKEGQLGIRDEPPKSPKVVDVYKSSPDLTSDDDYSWRFKKNNKTSSIVTSDHKKEPDAYSVISESAKDTSAKRFDSQESSLKDFIRNDSSRKSRTYDKDEYSSSNVQDDFRGGFRSSGIVHKEYDELRDELEYSMEMDTQRYLEQREEENPSYLNDVNSDEGRQLLSEKLSKLSETLTRIMSPQLTPRRRFSFEDSLPETPAINSPTTPINPTSALMSASTLSSRQSFRFKSDYPSNRFCDHIMSNEDLTEASSPGNLIHLYSTVDGQLQYERTIEVKDDEERSDTRTTDNSMSSFDIKYRNEYVPLNSHTAKDLTDEEILNRVITSDNMLNEEEILEQVFIKDLDTGEMIPLSVAEERLAQPDNTLRLHIMRIDTIRPNSRKKKTLRIDHIDDDNSAPFTVTKLQEKRKKIKRFFDKTIRKIKSSARRGSYEHCKLTDSILEDEHDEHFSIFDKNDHIYEKDRDYKYKFDNFQQKQSESYSSITTVDETTGETKKDSVMLDHIKLLKDLCGGHIGAIWTMNFVLYGKLLANAGKENIVRVWVMKDAALNFSEMRKQYSAGQQRNEDSGFDYAMPVDSKSDILI